VPVEAIERLTPESSDEAISEAISSCIDTEVGAGKEQKQAIAMCHKMARKKTGGRPTLPKVGKSTE